MHLTTIVKVRANDEAEAIERVNRLLTNYGEYNFEGGFDCVSEEDTKISEECKNETDFKKIRESEIEAAKNHLAKAEAEPELEKRAWDYRMAGEAFDAGCFWTTMRECYDYAHYDQNEKDGKNIYYLETGRHF